LILPWFIKVGINVNQGGPGGDVNGWLRCGRALPLSSDYI
jgi:hypothetical protein